MNNVLTETAPESWKSFRFRDLDLPYLRIVLAAAILLSVISAFIFISQDMHNMHFDSKGHQLVPRRIIDNLTPGFKQIGAFWLPLPHLLYLPLVKYDYFYFNGLAGTPYSMLSFILTVVFFFKLIERVLGKIPAFFGSVLYLTNPNMLYLQTTALTENLSLLFMIGSTYFFVAYVDEKRRKDLWIASLFSALGVLTRYENWFAFAMMGLLLFILAIKERTRPVEFIKDSIILLVLNISAMAFSFWLNWYTTGHFYLDHSHKHTDFQLGHRSFFISFGVILYTLGKLISWEWMVFSLVAFFVLLRRRFRDPLFIASLVMLGPLILYLYEYWDSHPTRIRYGLPFVPAAFYFVSGFAGRTRFFNYLFIVFGVYIALFGPFYRANPCRMVIESMRDAENRAEYMDLIYYIREHNDGELIFASMSDVAPLLYDLKFPIKRYIHEGAHRYWNAAMKNPEKLAGWVFLSQDDKLWKVFHDDHEFHRHYILIGRRRFLELYKRTPNEEQNIQSHPPHPEYQRFKMPPIPGI